MLPSGKITNLFYIMSAMDARGFFIFLYQRCECMGPRLA